jgi:SnoaL-like domain
MTPTPTTLTELADRDEIARLVHRLGACLDEARFDDLRTLFVDDAVARTPGGVAEGIDAVVAQASRNHSPDDGVQHLISGVLVDRDGDRATARANLVVVFARRDPDVALPTPFGPVAPTALGEVYRFTAARTPAGWRLTSVETQPVWVSTTPVAPVQRPAA